MKDSALLCHYGHPFLANKCLWWETNRAHVVDPWNNDDCREVLLFHAVLWLLLRGVSDVDLFIREERTGSCLEDVHVLVYQGYQ